MKIHGAVLHAMGATTPYAQSKPLTIEAVELDAPGPGEVLVKIAAAGPCDSDFSVINGDWPRPTPDRCSATKQPALSKRPVPASKT